MKKKSHSSSLVGYSSTELILIFLSILFGILTLINLTIVSTTYIREVQLNTTTSVATTAAYGTWFISDTFEWVTLSQGERVPFVLKETVKGIIQTEGYEYTFILPNTGVYMCTVGIASKFSSSFFNLVLNPDSSNPSIVDGSEFNSNGQWNEESLNPIIVLFNASAGDKLAVVYNESVPSDLLVIIGRVERGINPQQQPTAFINIVFVG